jgi:hypothetical protein
MYIQLFTFILGANETGAAHRNEKNNMQKKTSLTAS